MESLRRRIAQEEFDYQTLVHALRDYAHPRDKITDLLRKGVVIRVKKGLYVFGEQYRRRPISREVLANLVYGPSYVSLDSALQYHGLIPEAVEAVTSVTTLRPRRFHTPVGLFLYRPIPARAFSIGVVRVEVNGGQSFLIATPEKSLSDRVRDDRGTGLETQRQMREYLVNGLRIDEEALAALDVELIGEIARLQGSRKLLLLYRTLERMQRSRVAVHA